MNFISTSALFLAVSCLQLAPCLSSTAVSCQAVQEVRSQAKPSDVAPQWRGLVGEYVSGADTLCVLERDGILCLLGNSSHLHRLSPTGADAFAMGQDWPDGEKVCKFRKNQNDVGISMDAGNKTYSRIFYGEENGTSFRIRSLKPVEELRKEAMRATPPIEEGDFLRPNLVELVPLDSTFHLDIRYATTNNFLGEKFYSEARAFLQRPAAEALVRVQRSLRPLGFGLLLYDAYRPWYVTKMFWDATPVEKKEFVADPSKGSRHNRGCAVDLSLYELKSGQPVAMASGYDEFSHRAYPKYPGGTSLQRWHRELLRQAMEAEGFRVFESEWWHFDYKDWRRYPIGSTTFEMMR